MLEPYSYMKVVAWDWFTPPSFGEYPIFLDIWYEPNNPMLTWWWAVSYHALGCSSHVPLSSTLLKHSTDRYMSSNVDLYPVEGVFCRLLPLRGSGSSKRSRAFLTHTQSIKSALQHQELIVTSQIVDSALSRMKEALLAPSAQRQNSLWTRRRNIWSEYKEWFLALHSSALVYLTISPSNMSELFAGKTTYRECILSSQYIFANAHQNPNRRTAIRRLFHLVNKTHGWTSILYVY